MKASHLGSFSSRSTLPPALLIFPLSLFQLISGRKKNKTKQNQKKKRGKKEEKVEDGRK